MRETVFRLANINIKSDGPYFMYVTCIYRSYRVFASECKISLPSVVDGNRHFQAVQE